MHQKTSGLFVLMFLLHVLISGYFPDNGAAPATGKASEAGMDSFCSAFFCLLNSDAAKPDYEVFKKAFTGFLNLKATDRISKNFLTIIDFSLSSNLNRMWIIDMNKAKVVHVNLVAHGKIAVRNMQDIFQTCRLLMRAVLDFILQVIHIPAVTACH